MSSEPGSPQDDPSQSFVPPDTLDFLFEYTREAPQQQLKSVDALDNKAFALFSAGAVVVGLAGIGTWNSNDVPLGAGILLALAVLAFAVVGGAVLYSTWVRRFRLSFQANVLWEDYWDEDVGRIKHALVADIAAAYRDNHVTLERKAKALILALSAAIVEIALVGASLAWSSLA